VGSVGRKLREAVQFDGLNELEQALALGGIIRGRSQPLCSVQVDYSLRLLPEECFCVGLKVETPILRLDPLTNLRVLVLVRATVFGALNLLTRLEGLGLLLVDLIFPPISTVLMGIGEGVRRA
jgi:hypothetical protein